MIALAMGENTLCIGNAPSMIDDACSRIYYPTICGTKSVLEGWLGDVNICECDLVV